MSLGELIISLNRTLRGRANYFRHVCMKEVRRRFCDQGWRIAHEGVMFTGASSVAVTRYRYRGSTIATPWTTKRAVASSG